VVFVLSAPSAIPRTAVLLAAMGYNLPGGNSSTESTRPAVVLDTCVLVADPSSLDAYPGCDLVLPLTVIEELDAHKRRQDEVGRAARLTVRRIEALRIANGGSLRTPAALEDDATLRIETNGLRIDLLNEYALDPNKPDNRILAAALGLRSNGLVVKVVSLDVALRVKASQLDLIAEDYVVRAKIGEDSNITVLDVERSLVDDLYAQGSIEVEPNSLFAKFPLNSPLVLRSPTNGSALARPRLLDDNRRLVKVDDNLTAWGLRPRSKEQRFALDLLLDPALPIVALSGAAGTGKTILALAAALEQVFEPHSRNYDRLLILRPVVSVGRQDLGYLPGTIEEKLGPWFEAIVDTVVALSDSMSHREARDLITMWVEQGSLALDAVTFLRGRSLQRTFVLLDEAQNLEPLVAKTVLTRLGEGSKAVLLGDTTQIDSPWLSETSNALAAVVEALEDSELFGHLVLAKGERSPAADLAAHAL
jgi:PhoH-like ATPase